MAGIAGSDLAFAGISDVGDAGAPPASSRLILLITLLRAEKSVANGALTVITLLAVGVAVAATIRGYGPLARTTTASVDRHPAVMSTTTVSLPALACVDDIAGDAVAAACEKAVFASADSTAAAVNHMAQMITRLTSLWRRGERLRRP